MAVRIGSRPCTAPSKLRDRGNPILKMGDRLRLLSVTSIITSGTRLAPRHLNERRFSISTSWQFVGIVRHLAASNGQLISVRSPSFHEIAPLLDEHDQSAVICGLQTGNREAWAALYDGYSVDVWRYVARLVGPEKTDVADVVQDTFLAAARSARSFDPRQGSLWGWLTGIAHHHVSVYWRQINKAARLQALAEAHAGELHQWLAGSEADGLSFEQSELAELVRSVLAELPPDYAALLTAKYLEERSLDDMSRQGGQTVEALKSKLARARREFRRKGGRTIEVEA